MQSIQDMQANHALQRLWGLSTGVWISDRSICERVWQRGVQRSEAESLAAAPGYSASRSECCHWSACQISLLNVVSFLWVYQRFLVEVVAYCFPIGVAACECQEMSSCTSSYPDSCEVSQQRPKCLAWLTAATGGSAPSNRRTNTGFASCSYEQEPPDRKMIYTLSLPEVAEAGMRWGEIGMW